MDLGHYERLTDEQLTKNSSISSGKIYKRIFEKEAEGAFGGATIQIVPHVTNEIIQHLEEAGADQNADVVITEIGGTVGDIESQPFLEAIRQFSYTKKPEDVLFVHITLVPIIPISEELKSKPTQHSYRELMSFGINPDVLVLRSSKEIPEEIKNKIARFCSLPERAVVEARNVDILYELPGIFKEEGLDKYIQEKLKLEFKETEEEKTWEKIIGKLKKADKKMEIALVGIHTELPDAYLSTTRAIYDVGLNLGYQIDIKWVDLNKVNEKEFEEVFKNSKGIIFPGEINNLEKKIYNKVENLYKYIVNKNIPFLGIGPGFDYLYSILTNIMPRKINGDERIMGNREIYIKEGTRAEKAYGKVQATERFRIPSKDRYDKDIEEKDGFIISAKIENNVAAIIENEKLKYFIAVSYHPEFKSRPNRLHKIILSFIQSSIENIE